MKISLKEKLKLAEAEIPSFANNSNIQRKEYDWQQYYNDARNIVEKEKRLDQFIRYNFPNISKSARETLTNHTFKQLGLDEYSNPFITFFTTLKDVPFKASDVIALNNLYHNREINKKDLIAAATSWRDDGNIIMNPSLYGTETAKNIMQLVAQWNNFEDEIYNQYFGIIKSYITNIVKDEDKMKYKSLLSPTLTRNKIFLDKDKKLLPWNTIKDNIVKFQNTWENHKKDVYKYASDSVKNPKQNIDSTPDRKLINNYKTLAQELINRGLAPEAKDILNDLQN